MRRGRNLPAGEDRCQRRCTSAFILTLDAGKSPSQWTHERSAGSFLCLVPSLKRSGNIVCAQGLRKPGFCISLLVSDIKADGPVWPHGRWREEHSNLVAGTTKDSRLIQNRRGANLPSGSHILGFRANHGLSGNCTTASKSRCASTQDTIRSGSSPRAYFLRSATGIRTRPPIRLVGRRRAAMR